MLYKEYKRLFFEYCDSEITKELYRTRNRDNYINGKWKSLCILDKRISEESSERVVDLIVGDVDINIEPLVSLHLECKIPLTTINNIINTVKKDGAWRIYDRAISKLKNNNENKKGE